MQCNKGEGQAHIEEICEDRQPNPCTMLKVFVSVYLNIDLSVSVSVCAVDV